MTGMSNFDGPEGPGDEEEAEEVDGAGVMVSMAGGDASSSIVSAWLLALRALSPRHPSRQPLPFRPLRTLVQSCVVL